MRIVVRVVIDSENRMSAFDAQTLPIVGITDDDTGDRARRAEQLDERIAMDRYRGTSKTRQIHFTIRGVVLFREPRSGLHRQRTMQEDETSLIARVRKLGVLHHEHAIEIGL